mgnify:CR=1 FL=1|tara:strand:- start:159 stop:1241 length:1083 start_codon:yes stop_codon:yes gene_type:complete
MTLHTRTLTALAASALALSAAGTASAQTSYSSYGSQSRQVPSSCRNVETMANGYVSAECQTQGGWRWSAIRTLDCRSDLSNRGGVLSCTGATATTGPLYPDDSGYGGQTSTAPAEGGVIGALLGAVFGNAYGSNQQMDDAYQQGRRPLGEQRVALEARIDAGVRDGTLTRTEATRLRDEYDNLVRLETRYAADGRLTTDERNDLRDRYNALTQRVDDQRADGPAYGWQPLSQGRSQFLARVDTAERNRTLSRYEATRLRSDYDALVRVEDGYRRDGFSDREQQDLTTRLAELNRRLGDGGGYNDVGYGDDPRAAQIEARISAGERNGSLSRNDAARLRDELRELTRRWSDLEARVDQARR